MCTINWTRRIFDCPIILMETWDIKYILFEMQRAVYAPNGSITWLFVFHFTLFHSGSVSSNLQFGHIWFLFWNLYLFVTYIRYIYIYWQKCYNKWKHGNGWNSAAVWFLVFDFVQLVLLLYTYKNEIIIVWFECVCILNRSGFLLFIVLFVFIFR